jgi:hypothetical protein
MSLNAFYTEAYSTQKLKLITLSPIAIGTIVQPISQDDCAIAIGAYAGIGQQGECAIAIGENAGHTAQAADAIAIGSEAGETNQGTSAIAIGRQAGQYNQSSGAIAMGYQAGQTLQSTNAIAIGFQAGQTGQRQGAVAISTSAGMSGQATRAIAMGYQAGQNTQGQSAIAIGEQAGQQNQASNTVAIGKQAALNNQQISSIAIGYQSGCISQGAYAVAMGHGAGYTGQSSGSIAIGHLAGNQNQPARSIILNASTSSSLNPINTDALYINPIRSGSSTRMLYYNPGTYEIQQDPNVRQSDPNAARLSGSGCIGEVRGASGTGTNLSSGTSHTLVNITLNTGLWMIMSSCEISNVAAWRFSHFLDPSHSNIGSGVYSGLMYYTNAQGAYGDVVYAQSQPMLYYVSGTQIVRVYTTVFNPTSGSYTIRQDINAVRFA